MSVGSLPIDVHLAVTDVDASNRDWPWKSFAKHATQNQSRSLSALSLARTWRTAIVSEPMAGDEGAVSILCGQPVASTATLLVSVLPLRRPYKAPDTSPDEKMEHAVTFKPGGTAKGATRLVKYGPVCRAGAHVVSVTLNGAHVVGSPLQITVTPGPPEPSVCELRPYRSLAAGHHDWLGHGGGVLSCSGSATSETFLAIQLRDRYGNRCTNSQCAELLAEGASESGRLGGSETDPFGVTQGLLQLEVSRRRADGTDANNAESVGGVEFDPETREPSALKPVAGSAAADGYVSCRIFVAGVDGADQPQLPTPSTSVRGALVVGVTIARASFHLVSARLRRAELPTSVLIQIKPGPARASASTAHDLIEGEITATRRCVAGVARQLRLVGRDAMGNATDAPHQKWSVALRSAASDDHFRLHAAAIQAAAVRGRPPTVAPLPEGGVPSQGVPPPLLFTSAIEAAPTLLRPALDGQPASSVPRTAVLTYRCDTPGEHEMSLRFMSRPIKESPSSFTALVPAWGPGLREGVAGEAALLYIRLRPEGSAVAGSAAGRKLIHGVTVEAYERSTNEIAAVTIRQVVETPEIHEGGGGGGGGGASSILHGGGEVAEVALIATHASRNWVLSITVNNEHIVGSPFAWGVRPGRPNATRSMIHASWVGDRAAPAGVLQTGILEMRDQVGNTCGAEAEVQCWLREEFVIREPIPKGPSPLGEMAAEAAAELEAAKEAVRHAHKGLGSKATGRGGTPGSASSRKGGGGKQQQQQQRHLQRSASVSSYMSAGSSSVRSAAAASSVDDTATAASVGGASSSAAPPPEYQDERRTTLQQVAYIGNGKYQLAWTATRAGKHSLLVAANGQLLRCSMTLMIHADGPSAPQSEVEPPTNFKLLPQHWNILQMRIRDASGNPADLIEPSRLSVTCDGLASTAHLRVRERPGLDGAYEVLLFGEPVGLATLRCTIDGIHILNSPMTMDIAASSATAGRCYAFGAGLGSKGIIPLGTTARFTIVACDVTGTRRRYGGDPFKVTISPLQSAHHLALRVKIHDSNNGAYSVSWIPPFSGSYQVHITLRGLPIFASPFQVTVRGGGPYTPGLQKPLKQVEAEVEPTEEEIEAEIAEMGPSPSLKGLRSMPSIQTSPTVKIQPPGVTSAPVSGGAAAANSATAAQAGSALPRPSSSPGGSSNVQANNALLRPGGGSGGGGGGSGSPGKKPPTPSGLAAAAIRSIGIDASTGSPATREGVERAIEAARRVGAMEGSGGLSAMLGRFKRAIVEDDAEEAANAAASVSMPATPRSGTGSATDSARGSARVQNSGRAFSPD